ncbi:MAG: sigma-70 family RNA polymerase sigma factor [Caldilineales bacterium]|nr:sigma-70 family RNA polymerase sigma factor [Caldilineales bacterium]
MDDSRLIEAARKGDLPAFNQLVLQYQSLAYNVAYRIVGDGEAASDVTQDSFIKAYKALDSFRGDSFRPWLLRIVTNTCYDYLRARKRKPTDNIDDVLVDPEHSWRLVESGERPDEAAERAELNKLLQWAIGQLPDDQRAVVVLTDVQGFSYEETAEAMGIALGTVKSRLSRARTRLRDLLQQHQELLPPTYRLKSESLP